MDFPFNMGLGGADGDSIMDHLFGRNQYTPQSNALLAAPDMNSMPAGSPTPAPQVTTPNPSMGGGLAGMFGGGAGDNDKFKQFMAAMELMKNSQAQPAMQQPMNRPMQPPMATPMGGFGGMGQMPGGGGMGGGVGQSNPLMDLLRMAGQRRV